MKRWPSRKPSDRTWVSPYRALGQGTSPIPVEPSPFEKAVSDYMREKRRAASTLLGGMAAFLLVLGVTFFSLGRWSIPEQDRLVPEPALAPAEQLAWEAKIETLKTENIDLRLAVRKKEAAIEDLGNLIWSWVEKERRSGLEPTIPTEVSSTLSQIEPQPEEDVAALGADHSVPLP